MTAEEKDITEVLKLIKAITGIIKDYSAIEIRLEGIKQTMEEIAYEKAIEDKQRG